ncbi:MAG: 50S ribosomal protein L4 [Candidatus Lokiarchaeota archaeon]
MDKISLLSLDGTKKETLNIPQIFQIKPRKDLIQKAVEVTISKSKQIQGRDKRAGLRNTAKGWGTGHGMSRAPRIKGSGFSTARNVGRVPFAVGGRRTHGIKVEKNIEKKINKKEFKNSVYSAISATAKENWVKDRGHIIDNIPFLPLVIDDKIQTIKKTNRIYTILTNLGLKEELDRVKNGKRIRSGKGKRRGRKYKKKKGVLIIIKEDFGIVQAARNIPGVDITKIENLTINDLAPGGKASRLVIWTQSAFNELNTFEGK